MKCWTFLLVILVVEPCFISSNNTEIDSTFRLLAEGEKSIKFPEHSKNLILILGNTGGGKSTFTHWIAGDNSKLISKEVEADSGEFIIEDGNSIGSSTTVSKTTFPELLIDIEHNRTVFYDCPGFSDTRSTSYDIAATYFTKQVADFSHSVKMILVVSYPAVQKGVDRLSFVKLLRHATDFIKDIDQFKNSIAMIVTKVSNDNIKRGGKYIPVSDEVMINKIVSFLLEVKTDLENKFQMPDTSEREKTFCQNGVKFIDVVRQKNASHYSRIGIFRRPDEPGPLSNITLLQDGKEHINKVFHNNLIFTPRENHQFGYTVSDQSKNDVTALAEAINKIIWKNINDIVQKIQIYYSEGANKTSHTIQLLISSKDKVYTNQTEAYKFMTQQKTAEEFISILSNEVKNSINFKKLAEKNEKNVIQLNISDQFQSILAQGKYFEFLQTVSDRKLQIGPFDSLFEQLDNNLLQSKINIIKDVQNAVQVIDKKIKMNIEIITKEIEKRYLEKINRLEIEAVPIEMNKAKMIVFGLLDEIRDGKDVLEKVNQCIARLGLINFEVRQSVSAILNFEINLQFLSILSSNGTKNFVISGSDFKKWVEVFKKVENLLHESFMYYTFLNSLYDRFSQFDIQRDTTLYNVADVEKWGKKGHLQEIEITKDNLKQFLSKVRLYSLEEYNAVRNISVTESHLKTLNKLLTLLIKNNINFDCSEPGKLVVTGNFIKLSQLVDDDGKLLNLCKTKSNLNSINIFATNKIFIDRDFAGIGTKLKLSVIAPLWEIIGKQKIRLDGAPGQDQYKARDGVGEGSKGDDGLAGNPGGAAGNFFGVAAEVINMHGLTISVNGGQGGRGQDGGNGTDGASGTDASPEHENQDFFDHFISTTIGLIPAGINAKFFKDNISIYEGSPGEEGGNGGNGGVGGLGGLAGKVKMINLGNTVDLPSVKANKGLTGQKGIGGHGGSGGPYGSICEVTCKAYTVPGEHRCKMEFYLSREIGPPGSKGIDGVNTIGLKQPENPIAFQSISDVYMHFKAYLIENLHCQFKRRTLMQFVRQIDENSEVKESYDTLNIVNDLIKLEKKVLNLQKVDEKIVLYFYETQLSYIVFYANWLTRHESSEQQKIVLTYLYTAILSKLSTLKNKSKSELIIDIEGYLELVQKDINTLGILQEKSNKALVIDQNRNKYKSGIDQKIHEATSLIQDHILSEIENINVQLEQKINQLVEETITLQNQAQEEKENLKKKKQEIESKLVLSWIFKSLNIFGQALSYFPGPAGALGSTISIVNQVVEPLVLGDNKVNIQSIKLPDAVVSNLKNGVKNIKNEKITNFGLALNFVSGKVKVEEEIKSKYQSALNSSNLIDISNLENEMRNKLRDTDLYLKSSSARKKRSTKIITETIQKFNNILEFGEVAFNIYNKINNDQEEMDDIDESIEQAGLKIQSMKQYKTQIYNTLIPTLSDMATDLNEIAGQLGTKSQVSLDIQKWQVQDSLRNMELWLIQFTKGFEVEEDLVRCIDKLRDAMTTLITVYDRIQHFQEQKLLADYIADISSAYAIKINIDDPKLRQAVNDLEIVIRSNLILERYDAAVGALKQQVFPMAHFYLSEPLLPSSLAIENNFQKLVTKAIENVNKIKTKIQKYKTSITENDASLRRGLFSSEYAVTKPFFVWKISQYKKLIQQLLAGDKVVINANVLCSDPDKDAIKFNQIGFNFYSSYPNITSGIKKMLEGFSVNATHLGNSYYRYKNKVYITVSDSQNLLFSFQKDKDDKPVDRNEVYDKIKNGNIMLSPYAMWEIQLINKAKQISFNDLKQYANYVNLELVGYGNYLSERTEIPEVDNYYQLDSYLNAIN